jgi:4-hydroxybenzoate polyprenyltransferase
MTAITENIPARAVYKNLLIFVVSSSALIGSGFVLSGSWDFRKLVILLWLNFSGLYLIYRLNDFIDAQPDRRINLRFFFQDRKHAVLTFQLFAVCIPLAAWLLDSFSLVVLSLASLTGLFYSIQFRFGTKSFRLKNIFLLKNVLIGAVWGSLVLVGYGNKPDPTTLHLFIFVALQVVIGSIIRDIPDVRADKDEGVNSLPVVLGTRATYFFMHGLNLLAVALGLLVSQDLFILVAVISGWRFINLIFLAKNPDNPLWTQKINLLTCLLILCVLIAGMLYSRYVS